MVMLSIHTPLSAGRLTLRDECCQSVRFFTRQAFPSDYAPVSSSFSKSATTYYQSPDNSVCRVLIVEDHALIRLTLERLLTNLGAHVTACATAEAAKPCLSATVYNLMITDIDLPGQSGIELASWVKQQANTTPIVAVSGRLGNQRLQRCQAVGIDAAYHKPLLPSQVRALLNRYGGGCSA